MSRAFSVLALTGLFTFGPAALAPLMLAIGPVALGCIGIGLLVVAYTLP